LFLKDCHHHLGVDGLKSVKWIFAIVISPIYANRIDSVRVSMLASSAVDLGFELRSGRIKDSKIGICCFSAKHTLLKRKRKDWLAQNQDNVSEGVGGTCLSADCCFQWASTIKIPTKRVGLVQRGPHHHLIEK
jgi:hypothetical protein